MVLYKDSGTHRTICIYRESLMGTATGRSLFAKGLEMLETSTVVLVALASYTKVGSIHAVLVIAFVMMGRRL